MLLLLYSASLRSTYFYLFENLIICWKEVQISLLETVKNK